MFYQIFLSPQVKRIVIISNKHGIYELPHELPNDLRLMKLGNLYRTIAPSLPPKMKILSILAKECSKIETELFPHCAISH